jgi:hypothetical protein
MIFGFASGKPVESPRPIATLVTYCGLCIAWMPTAAIAAILSPQDVDVFHMTTLRESPEEQANLWSLIPGPIKGLLENISRKTAQ